MTPLSPLLVVGGGIGGLAAALACGRAGQPVQLYEQADEFAEVGAGIQLGPNVTRVLRDWGLEPALTRVAACPQRLCVRQALSGELLGQLRLGPDMARRYGAPYLTVHRADLHGLLLDAVRAAGAAQLHLRHVLADGQDGPDVINRANDLVRLDGVAAHFANGVTAHGAALIGADGLWSRVRAAVIDTDAPPRVTGHLAYRAMVPQAALPAPLRSQDVTVWLGPDLHVVQYPVRQGDWLNVVAIVHGRHENKELSHWDHLANASELRMALTATCAPLQALAGAIDFWRLWVLCDRPPLQGPAQMARGRVALLGDAAHPMRPYLAQGAGMALEDAAVLGQLLAPTSSKAGLDMAAVFQRYAALRWQRNARVQRRAIRNGRIFHLKGPLRWGRDWSLRLLGEKLLDVPWLYGHGC